MYYYECLLIKYTGKLYVLVWTVYYLSSNCRVIIVLQLVPPYTRRQLYTYIYIYIYIDRQYTVVIIHNFINIENTVLT
jgi:hypothetical protein